MKINTISKSKKTKQKALVAAFFNSWENVQCTFSSVFCTSFPFQVSR